MIKLNNIYSNNLDNTFKKNVTNNNHEGKFLNAVKSNFDTQRFSESNKSVNYSINRLT